MRIDRFMGGYLGVNRRDVKLILAQKRIIIDGEVAHNSQQVIDEFSRVTFDGQVLQAKIPRYIMMNKPVGVVSATKDDQHKTVIDLLDEAEGLGLHIVGRLDLNSSGLLLLTNDSRWSRRLMEPENKVAKVYRVTLENPLTESYISAFNDGMYFEYEDITTRPAKLRIMSEYVAEVTLVEGRYHQIKRMFGRFRNPVLALHRMSIGELSLDPTLMPGASRLLSEEEVKKLGQAE
jgi:16S rRNA pseudouridine516 synthase